MSIRIKILIFTFLAFHALTSSGQVDTTLSLWSVEECATVALSESLKFSRVDSVKGELGSVKIFYYDSLDNPMRMIEVDSIGRLIWVANFLDKSQSPKFGFGSLVENKVTHISLENGLLGVWVYLNEQGGLSSLGVSNSGPYDLWAISFWENGQIKSQTFHPSGSTIVSYTFYWPNGFLRSTGTCGLDGPNNDWRFYKSNGKPNRKAMRAFEQKGIYP